MTAPSPAPGQVWHVESWVLSGPDKKKTRPVVVVQPTPYGIVKVLGRTTDLDVKGIETPRDDELGLTEPGVVTLRWLHSIEDRYFATSAMEYRGPLPEPYLTQVLTMWENS